MDAAVTAAGGTGAGVLCMCIYILLSSLVRLSVFFPKGSIIACCGQRYLERLEVSSWTRWTCVAIAQTASCEPDPHHRHATLFSPR